MKDRLKPLKTIHLMLCLSVFVAYLLVGDLHTLEFLKAPNITSSDSIYVIFPILAIVLGYILYKRHITKAPKDLQPEGQVSVYQTALLIRWALLEGIAFFILFTDKKFIIIGLVLLLYLAYLRPSEEAMKRDFESIGKTKL